MPVPVPGPLFVIDAVTVTFEFTVGVAVFAAIVNERSAIPGVNVTLR